MPATHAPLARSSWRLPSPSDMRRDCTGQGRWAHPVSRCCRAARSRTAILEPPQSTRSLYFKANWGWWARLVACRQQARHAAPDGPGAAVQREAEHSIRAPAGVLTPAHHAADRAPHVHRRHALAQPLALHCSCWARPHLCRRQYSTPALLVRQPPRCLVGGLVDITMLLDARRTSTAATRSPNQPHCICQCQARRHLCRLSCPIPLCHPGMCLE